MAPSEHSGSLGYVDESEPSRASRVVHRRIAIESTPVVSNFDLDPASVLSDGYLRRGCLRVFHDVVYALLNYAIEAYLGSLVEETVQLIDVGRKADAGRTRHAAQHRRYRAREAEPVQMIRPQVVGNLRYFVDRLIGRRRDLRELFDGVVVRRRHCKQRSILD